LKQIFTAGQEAVLVARIKQRDQSAFHQLYDSYAPSLLGVLAKIAPNGTEANELLQKTFVKVWRTIHEHDPANGRLFTWLMNVARHTALDYRQQRQGAGLSASFNGNPVTYSAQRATPAGIQNSLATHLDDNLRLLIDLLYVQGYTLQETADQLALPAETVKTMARIALKELRKVLQPSEGASAQELPIPVKNREETASPAFVLNDILA
jgi:RNA polymerase sigma-70 factor, ECF subfamily